MINSINVQLPNNKRNYAIFDMDKVNRIVSQRENALPLIRESLKNSDNELEIVGDLYMLNLMLDEGVKGIDTLYPELSRFNDTKSPNIQTFLAGVYRKTKLPDAFGPLVNMLINNCVSNAFGDLNGTKSEQLFDANEEIGGAIVDYLA